MAKGLCSKCSKYLTGDNSSPYVFKQGRGWCRECRSVRDAACHADPVRREEKARKRRERYKSIPVEQKEELLKASREKDKKRYLALTPEKKKRIAKQAVISRRRRDTGVDNKEFEKRLTEQRGLCAVCSKPMNRPCQDHDHKTNNPRDILCHRCNVMLGLCFDSEEILVSAILYLRKHADGSSIQTVCENSAKQILAVA